MHLKASLFVIVTIIGIGFTGCQSHQSKVDALQKDYDALGQQYGRDCEAELTNVPPKLSPKCTDEKEKLAEAWDRLQAERARK